MGGVALSQCVCIDLTFWSPNQADTGLRLTYVAALLEWKSPICTDLTLCLHYQSDRAASNLLAYVVVLMEWKS